MEVLQIPSELDQMLELFQRQRPRRVLEIGTWDGGTLREWIQGKPELVVSVDLDHRHPEEFASWSNAAGTTLHLITGDSRAEWTKQRVRELAPFDWLFVDGDHGYDAAMSDARLALECATPGATLLLHDIADQEGNGPAVVLEQLAAELELPPAKFVDPEPQPWGHGIGVIQLP